MTNFRLIFSSRVLAAILWVAITAVWFGSRVDYIGGRPYTTAWGYDPKIYDPHRVSDPVAYSVFRHACESLYFEADDGQLYGVLAEDRFEYNEEGDLVSVILRSDVHFHDGTALTTSAVKDSFERLKLHGVSPLYEQLKDVKIIVRDAVTLEFHLPTPNRDFVRLVLSNPYAAIVNDVNRDDSIFVNCTGPYKFVEELYRPDAEIVLVRHKDYLWPPSIFSNRGPATIAQLHFLFIPDRKERFDRLLGGELCSLSLNAEQSEQLAGSTRFQLDKGTGGVTYLGFNFLKPIWQDAHIRRAFAMAIDRDGLASLGPFEVANAPLSRATIGYDSRVGQFALPYSRENALLLLEQTSFDMDSEIVLLIPESNTYRELAREVIDSLGQIGLTNIRIREVLRSEISGQRQDYDLLLFDYAWSDYSALAIFLGESPRNLSGYADPQVSALLQDAITSDPITRRKLLFDAQKIILEDAIWQPLVVRQLVLAIDRHCLTGEKRTLYGEILLHDAVTQ